MAPNASKPSETTPKPPEPGLPLGLRPADAVTLLAFVSLGLAGLAGAALVPVDTWLDWFHHPQREPVPTATVQGAHLWRGMLGLGGAVLLALAVVLGLRLSRAGSPSATPGHRYDIWIVLGLLCAGLLLRAWRLTDSLWYDEISAWLSFGMYGPGVILGNYFDPANHVFHTLLSWASVALLEAAMGLELALRVPALLASLAAIVAMLGLARTAFETRVSVVAAGLMTVLPVAVLEGAEARGYSVMIAFAAGGTWALIAAWRGRTVAAWGTYVLLAVGGAWTHPLTALVFVGHGIWLTWMAWRDRAWSDWRIAAAALMGAGTVTFVLYAGVLPDLLATREMYGRAGDDQPGLWGTEGLQSLLQLGGSWWMWSALPGLALLVAGLASLPWRSEQAEARAQRDAVALLWVGWVLAVGLVLVTGVWVYARFTLFALPGAVLLMALGVDWLWRWRRWAGAGALAVVALVSVVELGVRPAKQPLREAAEVVRQQRQASEPVVIVGLAHGVMQMYAGDMQPIHSLGHGQDLPAQLRRYRPGWVIVLFPPHFPAEREALLREQGYEVAERLQGWDDWGDVVVWERN